MSDHIQGQCEIRIRLLHKSVLRFKFIPCNVWHYLPRQHRRASVIFSALLYIRTCDERYVHT
jgi:hypothetical protein